MPSGSDEATKHFIKFSLMVSDLIDPHHTVDLLCIFDGITIATRDISDHSPIDI